MSLNNQNVLNMSYSNQQSIYQQLKKRVQQQNQRLLSNEERIKEMKKKIQDKKKSLQNKQKRLLEIQENIHKLKQSQQDQIEQQQSNQLSNGQSIDNILSVPIFSNSNSASHALLNHLREHYKALRLQLIRGDFQGDLDDDDQYQDEVDVDNMTYEELLELGEKIGKVSKGLDKKNLEALKVRIWGQKGQKKQSTAHECSICMSEFQNDSEYIELNCSHVFHNECIKEWLKMQKHCPYCKTQIFAAKQQQVLKPQTKNL